MQFYKPSSNNFKMQSTLHMLLERGKRLLVRLHYMERSATRFSYHVNLIDLCVDISVLKVTGFTLVSYVLIKSKLFNWCQSTLISSVWRGLAFFLVSLLVRELMSSRRVLIPLWALRHALIECGPQQAAPPSLVARGISYLQLLLSRVLFLRVSCVWVFQRRFVYRHKMTEILRQL